MQVEVTLVTYVEYLIGSRPSTPLPVAGRNPRREADNLPPRAWGFTYFEVWQGSVIADGEPIAIRSERRNPSKHYLVGQLLDRDGMLALPRDELGGQWRYWLRKSTRPAQQYVHYRGSFQEFDPSTHEHVESPA